MKKTARAPIFLLAGRPKSRGKGPDPLLQQVLETCGKAHPAIAYLGSASQDNREFFKMISALLKAAGAGDVALAPTAGRTADMARTRGILERANVILVSGGDVEEGMRVLDNKKLIPLLRALYEQGTVFLGLSAGSIMLAKEWVRWLDPNDDSTAQTFACLGLAPVLCDTHGEAEDWEELRALMQLVDEGTVGYGIPSGAALCVGARGELRAMGEPVHRFTRRKEAVVRIANLGTKVSP